MLRSFSRLLSLVTALALLFAVFAPAARAEVSKLVERNGDEVTYAEGYWKLITATDGKEYKAFFITKRAVSSKGRVHNPPEVFIDLSEFHTIQKTIFQTVKVTQEEIIRSPEVLSVSQYAMGSGRLRVSLKNDCPLAGERVSVRLLSPAQSSQNLVLAANGGTGEAVLQSSVWEPKTETVSLEAVVTENLDPCVVASYRYPQNLKTTWQGPVTFQFYAPRVTISPSGMDAVVSVTNLNEVRGQIQVYYELRKVSDSSLIENGFLAAFGDPNSWWDGKQTRNFNIVRPSEAYSGSVKLSVNTRYGNSSGPTASADFIFETKAPSISASDQGSYVRFTVTNSNNFGGDIRIYITHDGTGVYGPTTSWFNAGESRSFDVDKNGSVGGQHTVSCNARFNPDTGPNTIKDITYSVYAPSVSLSDQGSYIRVTVTNSNNFGGNVRVYITHDGSSAYGPSTFWLNAGGSWSYTVSKKTSSGYHTVSCNARFCPDTGPNTIRDITYYVTPPPPPYVYTSGGTVYVRNPASKGGWFRVYDYNTGKYLAGSSSSEQYIGPNNTWSYYVGKNHSGAFKGWNNDYSELNSNGWST